MDLRSLAAFRIALACALVYELSDRVFSTNTLEGFYSEEGIWPARLMQDHSTPLHVWLSPHSWYDGSLTAALLVMQFGAAFCLLLGWQARLAALLSWLLYNSLTLRNVWLSYIADRYFHILLLYAALLPCGRRFSLDRALSKGSQVDGSKSSDDDDQVAGLPVASLLFKLQILWIYLDAGWGKLNDPLQGWSFGATPLSALDTYTRHTHFAIWLYRALGPQGLRLMTPTVVAAELLAPAAVLVASAAGASLWFQVGLICVLPLMHLGISLALVNTVSLSIVAAVAWLPFVPGSAWVRARPCSLQVGSAAMATTLTPAAAEGHSIWPSLIMLAFMALCAHHEFLVGSACTQAGLSTVSSVLLNNRWNVFVGADSYVTWEIAPAKLADGRVVDLWTRGGAVSWDVPSLLLMNHSASAPGTTAFVRRSGRWRSFPYLSVAEGAEGAALLDGPWADNAGEDPARQNSCLVESQAAARPLDAQFHRRVWTYLCTEWNTRQPPSARVLRYSFFMLQADIEPGLSYSAVRKRLIHSHECLQPTPGEAVFENEK